MKSTGIVRKVDGLGRIVLPKELLCTLNISAHDALEIFMDNDRIFLNKYEPGCIFCGRRTERIFKGKRVCTGCAQEAKSQ